MSFGVGVGDIIAVANIANKVRKRFVDSPDQFKAVAGEVKSLSNVLRDLEDVFPERTITDQQKAALKETLQGCRNTLTALDQVLDKYGDLAPTPDRTGLAQKSRRLWKRLTFEPEDVSNLRLRLTSNIGLFNAFMGNLALGVSQATKAGVDRLNTHQDKEKYLKALDWLSNPDFPAQQNDIYKECQEGTGQWLLKSYEYMKWIDGVEPTLFCPGIPGAGKTFLTSIVVHDLHEKFDGNPEVVVACLYLNYKRHAEQTIENLLASLLKQLVQGRPELFSDLESLYTSHNERRTRPSVDELSKTLHAAMNRCTEAFIVIDALDECANSRTRLKLLKEVTALQAQQETVRFLTTSRFIPDIVAEFDGKPALEIRADDGDVRSYLEHHLEDLPLCVQRNLLLQATIVIEISRAVDGMFLLAQLHLGSLSDKTTVKAVKLALQQLPKGSQGLHMAYDKTIERIDNQQLGFQQLAKQTLSWIVYATRQLSVLELRHALAVEDEATELDEENLAETDEIIHACAGLVTVEKDTNIIRLVHYTTQEYLERKLLTWEPFAETAITRTCLSYLSFDVITTKNANFLKSSSNAYQFGYDEAFNNVHFLGYAVDAWHNHAEHCWNDVVEQLVLSFLEGDPQILYYGARRYVDKFNFNNKGHYETLDTSGSKPMHFAALFGLVRIATALLQAGYNTRVADGKGRTPLTYAAMFGHQAVAKLLLKDAVILDYRAKTPLHYAAKHGYENIVKLLLSYEGIDVNAQSFYYHERPLNLAIKHGHEGVVRLLLERDEIDVARCGLGCGSDCVGDSGLITAVIRRNEGILQQLLGRDDVDLNYRDDRGETALMLAARRGNTKMFKQLLETPGVEVHHKNRKNQTLLMLAVSYSSQDVVELLLDREDIDVNCKDHDGRTALIVAVSENRPNIDSTVRKLLERNNVDVNCQDNKGRTALMMAARGPSILFDKTSRNCAVVKQLLMTEDINVNSQDNKGQTALMWAASSKNNDVVNRLLMREEIDVNCQDNEGRTVLMMARYDDENSLEDVIDKFFEKRNIDVNCRDKNGQTALMMAVNYKNYDLANRLLMREEIDVNSQDNEGRTALMMAADGKNYTFVDKLLMREEIDVNCQDNEGRTALMMAATVRDHLTGRLLEIRGTDFDGQDEDGQTAFILADIWVADTIVNRFLTINDIDRTGFDRDEGDISRLARRLFGLSRD